MKIVRTAVFPVAGIGSRFLPATKASPKEMLPLVDKPLIQYAVEEAIVAGITHMVFVTNSSKRAIEDHFDKNVELEMQLRQQAKHDVLQLVENIAPPGIHFTYIRQSKPLGLGHAVLCAEHVVGEEPFVVILADDLIDPSQPGCLSAMIDHFQQKQHSILAVQSVDWQEVHKYGIVDVIDKTANYSAIQNIIEKPALDKAPSNLASIGRYLFTPTIFTHLKAISADTHGEFQLTDAIAHLLSTEQVDSYLFKGKRFDCGSKLGYLQASVELGLRHEEIGQPFLQYLKTYLSQHHSD